MLACHVLIIPSIQRIFVVRFKSDTPVMEEQQMTLLSETVSFLVANGNKTTDEVKMVLLRE